MDSVEYTIRIPATLHAALRRQARETRMSLDRTLIEALPTGLEIAHSGHPLPPGQVQADGTPAALEQDALEEGTWL